MRRLLLSLLPVLALVVAGCGESPPATLTGEITIDGDPIPSESNVSGTVMLYPTARGAAAYGSVHAGHYEVKTGDGSGLEPGTYDVTVRIVEIGQAPASGNPPSQTLLHPGHYEQREHSGLQCEVKKGANTYDIALER